MNKICIVGLYFGALPKYFSLWLKSCRENSDVDFLLITDQEIQNLPRNVKAVPMTLAEVRSLAEKVLGFSPCLNKPYKCCDYKVLYGLIFQEYLTGYQYWGHCDFDVLFGDLQYYFETYNIEQYDRFLTLGHLSLYCNTETVNNRYKCAGSQRDYKTVYTTDESCAFDELPGMTAIYVKNKFPQFTKRIFADIASVYHRYRIIEGYPLDTSAVNYREQVFFWEKGKVYRAFIQDGIIKKEEYIYIHFKKRPNFSVGFDVNGTDAFFITNCGFFPKEGDVTREDILRYNPYPGKIFERWEEMKHLFSKSVRKGKRMIRKVFKWNGCK